MIDETKQCPICGAVSLVERHGEYRFETPPKYGVSVIVVPDARWHECTACASHILSPQLDRAIEDEWYNRRTPDTKESPHDRPH